jgi:hypothetical protein
MSLDPSPTLAGGEGRPLPDLLLLALLFQLLQLVTA